MQKQPIDDLPDYTYQPPKGTVLLAYRGSIAQGMYRPSNLPNSIDDIDLIGLVIGEENNYFGLQEWGSRGAKEIKEGKYDSVFYEAKKFVSLLLKGNPNIVSSLWNKPEHYLKLSGLGKALIDNRELFNGKHVYNSSFSGAYSQLMKMESRDPAELREYLSLTYEAKVRGVHPNNKGEKLIITAPTLCEGELKNAAAMSTDVLLSKLKYYMKKGDNLGYLGDKRKQLVLENGLDTKNAAHCVRLLRMASEYLKTGEMVVYRPDAEELLDIKTGKWTLNQIKSHAEDLFTEMKEAKDNSKLPELPDRAKVEKLLVSELKNHFLEASFISNE